MSTDNSKRKCNIQITLHGMQKEDTHFLIQSKLYELLNMIYNDSKLDSVSTPEAIKKAMDFMENNFQKQILLQDIAERCGFSSLSYFDYQFKKTYGISPVGFRKQKYTM